MTTSMNKNYFYQFAISLLLVVLVSACHRSVRVVSVSTEAISIDETKDSVQDSAYLAMLQPVTTALNEQLDIVIGYAPEALTVEQPECTMLNWASDALLAVARRYCPEPVDLAIVNIGGMRTQWEAGDITLRSVYELMPFDNELVVLTLSGADIVELCQIFAEDGGQGVAGLRMAAEQKQLIDVTIGGKPVDDRQLYRVATSDYLAGGTDHMIPLTRAVATWRSEQKIRDLYIEYISENKTVTATVDGRMDVY